MSEENLLLKEKLKNY